MTDDREKKRLDNTIMEGFRSMPEVDPPKGFSARVMENLEPKRPSAWIRFRLWLTEPRSVTFTPARMIPVLAAAMVLLALGFHAMDTNDSGNGMRMSTIRFVLNDSGMNARTVAVIGSFNSWQAQDAAMRFDDATGAWVLEAQLPPGDHEYMFLVDGQNLMADPLAQMTRDDGFGNRNSIVFVNGTYEQAL
jgi:hypothetical protein